MTAFNHMYQEGPSPAGALLCATILSGTEARLGLSLRLCYFWACGITTAAESFLKESSKIQPARTIINPQYFCFSAYKVACNYSVNSTILRGGLCRFEGNFLFMPFFLQGRKSF